MNYLSTQSSLETIQNHNLMFGIQIKYAPTFTKGGHKEHAAVYQVREQRGITS